MKEICDNAFCGCENLHLIKFKENPEIQSIGIEVFYNSNVECIEIPSNIKELKEDWCFETRALNRIKVIENGEENVKIINNNLLVEKSDLKSDIFDVVLFAPRAGVGDNVAVGDGDWVGGITDWVGVSDGAGVSS